MSGGDTPAGAPLSVSELFQRVHLARGTAPDPVESLRGVAARPLVVQDFRPLPESLEWELARSYWHRSGTDAFAQSEVPFLINNDGRASEDAAVTFFALCREAKDLPAELAVQELGAGTGLFCRFFLDAFAAICGQEGADYYDRLRYVITDGSPRTVEQWFERDVFGPHADRCVAGVADAATPGRVRPLHPNPHGVTEMPAPTPLAAVFCNYALDVLPASVVRQGPEQPEQLWVRTCLLDDPAAVAQYTPLDLEQIRLRAGDAEGRHALLPLLPVLELETRFQAVADGVVPFLDEALAWGAGLERILLNHGAFATIDACFDLLAPSGILLINDYGPVRRDEIAAHAALQRFGGSAAHGINFPLLAHHAERRALNIVEPPGDEERSIHSRLLGRRVGRATRDAFQDRFGKAAYDHRQGTWDEARRHAAAGRKEQALEAYKNALALEPRNWCVIGEAAEFVGLQLREFQAGVELAQAALERNPWYSPWLWNVLGDCLFCLERFDDAHEAYVQAGRIDAHDSRTHLNLAYTLAQRGDLAAALQAVARGLAHDTRGLYRNRLLEKQQQILIASSTRWLAEQERLAHRAGRFQ